MKSGSIFFGRLLRELELRGSETEHVNAGNTLTIASPVGRTQYGIQRRCTVAALHCTNRDYGWWEHYVVEMVSPRLLKRPLPDRVVFTRARLATRLSSVRARA